MNLGQRIFKKDQNNQSIDEEIEELKAIINQIDENEQSVPEIDLNSDLSDIYKELEEYIKLVDQKLYDIKKKYFEPNGLDLIINIYKTMLFEEIYLTVDSRNFSDQNSFQFIEEDLDRVEYEYVDSLVEIWENILCDELLSALNISKLAMILGAFWYIDCYGDKDFKVIETNRDT